MNRSLHARLAGIARLGFVTELLSKPIRYGYMNGIALTVLLSQIPKLFGFSVAARGPLPQVRGLFGRIADGSTNGMTLAIGAGAICGSALALWWRPRRPLYTGLLLVLACQAGGHRRTPDPVGQEMAALPAQALDDNL